MESLDELIIKELNSERFINPISLLNHNLTINLSVDINSNKDNNKDNKIIEQNFFNVQNEKLFLNNISDNLNKKNQENQNSLNNPLDENFLDENLLIEDSLKLNFNQETLIYNQTKSTNNFNLGFIVNYEYFEKLTNDSGDYIVYGVDTINSEGVILVNRPDIEAYGWTNPYTSLADNDPPTINVAYANTHTIYLKTLNHELSHEALPPFHSKNNQAYEYTIRSITNTDYM